MARMDMVCPECQAGKHRNCVGVSDIDGHNNPVPCLCTIDDHPIRKPIVDPEGNTLWDDSGDYLWSYEIEEDRIYFAKVSDFDIGAAVVDALEHGKNRNSSVFIPDLDKVPDGPGLLTEAFPELSDEPDVTWYHEYRMRPDAEIIKDFHDVEVMNPQGVWVPAIPYPIKLWLGVVQCHCGKRRLGDKRYQEHYAYAHIMGMDN